MSFFDHPACVKRAACVNCRTSRAFRETIFAKGQVSEVDFACPHGITVETAQPFRLGDLVEKLAKPIAKVLGMDCLDENDRLKPGSKCAQRRDRLNGTPTSP